MMRKILVAAAMVFSSSVFADECATRVMTDKVLDSKGSTIVTEQSRTSCGNAGSNLQALVGIDSYCYYYPVRGEQMLACQYPNGQWATFADTPVDALDAFAGDEDTQTGKYSTNTHYMQGPPSFVMYIGNFLRWWNGNLSAEAKKLHERSVIFAVEQSKNGQLVSWQTPKGNESGRIKVVSTLPVQGGVCRRMIMEINVDKNTRNHSETACYNISTNKWHFSQ